MNMFPALWQARFLGAEAEAAVGVGAIPRPPFA
jgi:hypothetical protein